MNLSNEKEYEDRYCAFVDFLGFKHSVASIPPKKLLTAMKMASTAGGKTDDLISVTQFSDSLVISGLVCRPETFLAITSRIFFLTIELANLGVLLRGGITKGKMFHNKNIAFGPAFIRAYELEQAASYPRVIIDSDIASQVIWLDSMDKKEIKYFLKHSLPRDFDGWRYVDFLSSHRMSEFDTGDEGYKKSIENFEKLAENLRATKDPSILSKYGWLKAKIQRAQSTI